MKGKNSAKSGNAFNVNPFLIAELRGIIGSNLDNTALVKLLKRANGVVERAVNFFLDEDHKPVDFSSRPAAISAPNVVGIDKQIVGVPGETKDDHIQANRSGTSRIGNVSQERAGLWPKFFGAVQVKAYTTVDIGAELLPVGSRIAVSRRATSDKEVPSSKRQKTGPASARRPPKKDFILRWGVGSRECGRLPAEISKPLAILMDCGWMDLDGVTVGTPDSTRKFANVPISLNIRMHEFTRFLTGIESEPAETDSPQEALIRLLDIMKFVPRVPCEIAKINCDRGNAVNGQPIKKGVADDEDPDEATLSREHIDILFDDSDPTHALLPAEPQPPAMLTSLRDYQLQVEDL